MGSLTVSEAVTKRDRLLFVRCPWLVYRGDLHWVPPLVREDLARLSSANPFFSHAEAALFLAQRGGRVVGRVAAIVDRDYIRFHGRRMGFFGFFEALADADIAPALLGAARGWLAARGMEEMAGPMNPSTNDECGLLVDGFDADPCFMMPYNPPYYPPLMESFGLRKVMDLFAYQMTAPFTGQQRLEAVVARIRRRDPGLTIRPIDMRRFGAELEVIRDIYNQAWHRNWGFVPLSDAEIAHLAKGLKPLVVPDLCLFVCRGQEPVGFSVTLPDYNFVLKRLDGRMGLLGLLRFFYLSRRIKGARVMLLGIRPAFRQKGAEAMLYLETYRRLLARGYRRAEFSWILEGNHLMQRGIEAWGGEKYKTYRIYGMSIS